MKSAKLAIHALPLQLLYRMMAPIRKFTNLLGFLKNIE